MRLGLVAESNVVKYLSEELGLPVAEKAVYPEAPVIVEGLREQFLLNNDVVPLSSTGSSITFAALKPQDDFVRKALQLATGKQIELQLGVAGDIEAALKLYVQGDQGTNSIASAHPTLTTPNLSSISKILPVKRRSFSW